MTLTFIFEVIQPWLCNKLLKYGTSWGVHSTASTVLVGFFPCLAQIITGMRKCVMHFDLDLYLQVIQPWLCNETAKIWHILPCPLCSMYSSGWILSYLALMITSTRGCVTLWPWPISSRLFSCDIAHFVDYIHVSQIQPVEGQCVTFYFSVNRSKVKVTQVRIFAVWAGGILVEISDLQFLVIAEWRTVSGLVAHHPFDDLPFYFK